MWDVAGGRSVSGRRRRPNSERAAHLPRSRATPLVRSARRPKTGRLLMAGPAATAGAALRQSSGGGVGRQQSHGRSYTCMRRRSAPPTHLGTGLRRRAQTTSRESAAPAASDAGTGAPHAASPAHCRRCSMGCGLRRALLNTRRD